MNIIETLSLIVKIALIVCGIIILIILLFKVLGKLKKEKKKLDFKGTEQEVKNTSKLQRIMKNTGLLPSAVAVSNKIRKTVEPKLMSLFENKTNGGGGNGT